MHDGVDASMARTDNHNHNSDKSEITIESTEVESAKLTGCFLILCMLCILIMVILDKLPEHQDVTVAAKPVGNKKKLWRGLTVVYHCVAILLDVARSGIN